MNDSMLDGILYVLTKTSQPGIKTMSTTFPSNWGDRGAEYQQKMTPMVESPVGKNFDILQGGIQSQSNARVVTSELKELDDITGA